MCQKKKKMEINCRHRLTYIVKLKRTFSGHVSLVKKKAIHIISVFFQSLERKQFLTCPNTVFTLFILLLHILLRNYEWYLKKSGFFEYFVYHKNRSTKVWLKIKISTSSVACNVLLCPESGRQSNTIT